MLQRKHSMLQRKHTMLQRKHTMLQRKHSVVRHRAACRNSAAWIRPVFPSDCRGGRGPCAADERHRICKHECRQYDRCTVLSRHRRSALSPPIAYAAAPPRSRAQLCRSTHPSPVADVAGLQLRRTSCPTTRSSALSRGRRGRPRGLGVVRTAVVTGALVWSGGSTWCARYGIKMQQATYNIEHAADNMQQTTCNGQKDTRHYTCGAAGARAAHGTASRTDTFGRVPRGLRQCVRWGSGGSVTDGGDGGRRRMDG